MMPRRTPAEEQAASSPVRRDSPSTFPPLSDILVFQKDEVLARVAKVRGWLVEVSSRDIELEFQTSVRFPEDDHLVFGMDALNGETQYAEINIDNFYRSSSGKVRVVGHSAGVVQDILNQPLHAPYLCPKTHTFRFAHPESLLRQLCGLGIVEEAFLDRVEVCPNCSGLPTFRPGCQHCGSPRTTLDRLIHHFACGYVGFVSEFEDAGRIICPKCRTKDLVVGADFEYIDGAHRCFDCAQHFEKPERIGHCLGCDFRFPAQQADLHDLMGFRPKRLDILAFSPAS